MLKQYETLVLHTKNSPLCFCALTFCWVPMNCGRCGNFVKLQRHRCIVNMHSKLQWCNIRRSGKLNRNFKKSDENRNGKLWDFFRVKACISV